MKQVAASKIEFPQTIKHVYGQLDYYIGSLCQAIISNYILTSLYNNNNNNNNNNKKK